MTHGEATAESQGSAPYPSRSLITFPGFHRRNFFLGLDYFGLSVSLAVGGIAIMHRFSVGPHRNDRYQSYVVTKHKDVLNKISGTPLSMLNSFFKIQIRS